MKASAPGSGPPRPKEPNRRCFSADARQAARDFAFYAEHPEWSPDVTPASNRFSEARARERFRD